MLVIIDTPGKGDTKSAEVEISNAISIVHSINASEKPIYPVLLFSSRDGGARLDGL
jgi:hypothetical protein